MGRIIIALSLEVILLALSIQTGESIKCYFCSSQWDNKCADPIDISGLTQIECSSPLLKEFLSSLRKNMNVISKQFGMPEINQLFDLKFTCQKFYYSDQSGNRHIFRSCMPAKSEYFDPCTMFYYASKWTNGKLNVDNCETCETDLCNGASLHSFTIISTLVVPCFAIIISH